MKRILLKADLHVHSKFSTRPSEWILRKLGCAESYTEPLRLYEIARSRGMDLVTITDHNTLSGSLEIAHLEHTFISEEITAYFPEDRCKLHVLAFGLTEAHHEDISRCRENVFDLVRYLDEKEILYAVAHPLYAINERLTPVHVERMLVLFQNFELNGSRDDFQNDILKKILSSLEKEDIDRLADKNGLTPAYPFPWKKNLIAGSDDHSSLNIAMNYTEVHGADSIETFFAGIREGTAHANGLAASPKTLAHNIYSIAYQFYNSRFDLEQYVGKDLLMRFIHRALTLAEREEEGLVGRIRKVLGYRKPSAAFEASSKGVQALFQREAKRILTTDANMKRLLSRPLNPPGEMEEAWFEFVNQLAEKILKLFADSALINLSGANLFDLFHTLGSAGSLYTMLAPYLVSYTVFAKDRRFCRRCRDIFTRKETNAKDHRLNVAHFTDTFHDVNGVALTLRMQVETAKRTHKQLTMITCGPPVDSEHVVNFEPIGTFEMPEYPGMKLYYPPLLRMLDYCYEKGFTHIHSATPGPIGIAALIIARILNLPVFGTYHTDLPRYVDQLTEDTAMSEICWRYSVWYYNQMDAVYAPSHATGDELVSKGVKKEKVRFYPRGIDIERFHPSKRNGFFENRYASKTDLVKLLYVGRISKEKNLLDLVEICRRLHHTRRDFHVYIVGDGPFMKSLKEAFRSLPATMTGFLEGDALAQAYASSDIFIFPSTTDTFGNVVLEAQAAGVPVIVTDEGGPRENLLDKKTGYIVPAGDIDAFVERIRLLMDNAPQRIEMGRNARRYVENRSFDAAYIKLWESYKEIPVPVAEEPA